MTEALRHGPTAERRERLLAEGRAMSAEAAAEVARAVVDARDVGIVVARPSGAAGLGSAPIISPPAPADPAAGGGADGARST